MSPVAKFVRRLLSSERGSQLTEWVLICGLITVAAVVSIAGIGTKAAARWSSVNSFMP